MFDIFNDKDKIVHFIGIGGISMSGLAEILIDYGYSVSGSDRASSPLTKKLESMGAKIYIGQREENVHGKDIVVYTAAIKQDNPELKEAKSLNIPTMDRAEFLGLIMKKFKNAIAVSGTHGKTTATSMISLIMLKANLDPTILVGGELDAIGGNVRSGKSSYFLTEACEYTGSFLKFFPYIGIILNVDADHLDYYKDIDDIQNAFLNFGKLIPENGTIIGCADDDRVLSIMKSLKCNKIGYGLNRGDYIAKNVTYNNEGYPSFDVYNGSNFIGHFSLNIPGQHNVLNALSSICCGLTLGININVIKEALFEFRGAHRRFEKKGIAFGAEVIDDYAHHPTAIKASIKAILNHPHKKIYLVFQPHTYSRTKSLFDEFSKAFNGVDELLLLDIYAAREIDDGSVSSKMLCDAVSQNGVNAKYMPSFEAACNYLKSHINEGDLVITMGAGDVYKVGDMLLK